MIYFLNLFMGLSVISFSKVYGCFPPEVAHIISASTLRIYTNPNDFAIFLYKISC